MRLAAALIAFVDGMRDITGYQAMMSANVPQFVWTRDAVIVMLSARLSIALIPIAMVWLSAVRFARWILRDWQQPVVLRMARLDLVRGEWRRYYAVPYGPYYIWGATARILRGLADRVQE